MEIREVMSHPVHSVRADASLNAAAAVMWDCDCGVVPVVDHDGRLAGVVTDRDICMAAYTKGRPIAEIPVEEVMAREVLACHVNDSVATAEELMREGQVRRIPVIDNDGRLAGIVSMSDLAQLADSTPRGRVDREVLETLAAVSKPRGYRGRTISSEKAVVPVSWPTS
jgi:CBS domain-containing protein